MSNCKVFQDWLEVHQQLIALETEFTQLAIEAALGKVPRHELEQRRAFLLDARLDCSEAYQRAFAKPPETRWATSSGACA
jgi:hypothetical protein